jgi:RNA polymerase sigma-70 factor (ECF subfamily)
VNNEGDIHRPRPLHEANEDTDWDLIRRVGEGDCIAFETLYKRYYQYLFRFVYRVTHQLGLVEEIINDAMFAVWQKAGTVEARSRASTWIMGIAYKKSLKSLYHARDISDDVSLDEIEHGMLSEDNAMIEQLEVENLAVVAFGALSPEQRAAMELAYHQGMHYSEIAKVMGCPENTVKTRMFHARNKLRSLLPGLFGDICSRQKQG